MNHVKFSSPVCRRNMPVRQFAGELKKPGELILLNTCHVIDSIEFASSPTQFWRTWRTGPFMQSAEFPHPLGWETAN